MAIDTFISYAHADKALYEQLMSHLKPLEREHLLNIWSDPRILPGTDFSREILLQLHRATLILLLVSRHFVVSEFCWSVEMERAMARQEAGTARVIPIILSPVDWNTCPFGRLQALPQLAAPVTTWPNRDEAFVEIARSIRQLVQQVSRPFDVPETATVFIETHDLGAACDIFIDDKYVHEIASSARIQMGVEPGEHFIQMFAFPRQKSNRLPFQIGQNGIAYFDAWRAEASPWMAMVGGYGIGELFVIRLRP